MSWICQVFRFHVFAYQIRRLIFEFFTYVFLWLKEIAACVFLGFLIAFLLSLLFSLFVLFSCPVKSHFLISVGHQPNNQVNSQYQQQRNIYWTDLSNLSQNREKLLTRKNWDLLLLKWVYGIFLESLSQLIWCILKRRSQKCSVNIIKN